MEPRQFRLKRHEKPTEIFALSHLITLGTLKALQNEGLNIPDSISVVSFDDLPFTEFQNVQISAVKQPILEMGSMAVKLLREQIESRSKKAPVHIKLPVTLIKRNSVKRLS